MQDNSPAARAERQHRAKRDRKPKEVYDIKELRVAGHVRRANDLETMSSRRWRDTHRWIPLSIRWIQGCCLVATLAASGSLAAVLLRDPPVLLLAYPNGTIRCAPTPIDPDTGKPRAYNRSEAELCARMAAKFGE